MPTTRFPRQAVLGLLLALAVAAGLGIWLWIRPRPVQYEELNTLLDKLVVPSRRMLIRLPDRPGPYVWLGTWVGHTGEPVSGWFEASNGKRRRYFIPAEKGVCFEVVGLEPAGGEEPTFVVFRVPVNQAQGR